MSGRETERRQFGRIDTYARGWIVVPDRPRLPCKIRNMSLSGALLELKTPSWLPRAFKLVVETMHFESFCEVQHSADSAVGVRFCSQPANNQAAPPSLSAGERPTALPVTVGSAELREFGRRETNLRAWINVPGRPKIQCTVLDLSIGGAFLKLDHPTWLSFNFQLTIEATRFTSMCELRHQSPKGVGVRFLAAAEQTALERRRISNSHTLNERTHWMGSD